MGRKEAEALVPEGFVTSKIVYMTGFWAEALLYGIYFCLFVAALNIMLRKRTLHTFSSRVFLVGIVVMFVLITLHNFFNIYSMIEGYAYQTSLESPVHFMRNTTNWARYSFPVILALVIWIGDALVIYRCFIIWQRNYYAILLPLVLLLSSISFHSVNLWWFGNPTARSLEDMRPIMSTTFPLHFAQNVVTTGMIAFKLWQHHRRTRRVGVSVSGGLSMITIVRIMVESALLYTVQMAINIVLFFLNSSGQVVIQHCLIPTTGIVFALIAIRAHSARYSATHSEHNPPSKSLIPSWLHGGENDVENQRTGHSNMPVVTTVTEEHRMDDISHTIKLPDQSRRSRVGASDSHSSPNERDDDQKVPVGL
ncbi:hypothetical protein CC2G_012361 [Coprinopsis cinerea AmutBmut pab1-1]|nr:hypothetical protein CC2G_012361 [Coprinopsis cinerea AmutBmut pab1-1]